MEEELPESLLVRLGLWYLWTCLNFETWISPKTEGWPYWESVYWKKNNKTNQKNQKNRKNTEKNRLTSTSPNKIFIGKKNFDTLNKQIDKPFNEQIESLKQDLYHGIKNEALAIEKYQFIMSYKLNRPVKIREAGITIQS